jgi:hypothetical protein
MHAVAEAACRPMHGRLDMHDEPVAEIDLVTPIHGGCRQTRYFAGEDRVVAERRNDARAELLPQSPDRLRVHVIVVIMCDEHGVDVRQILESDAWRICAVRSDK